MLLEGPTVEVPSADGVGVATQWKALEEEINVWHLPFLLYPAEPGTPAGLRSRYYKLAEQVFPPFSYYSFSDRKRKFHGSLSSL